MVSSANIKELVSRHQEPVIVVPEFCGGIRSYQQAFVECLKMYPLLSSTQKTVFDTKVRELSDKQKLNKTGCDPFSLYANYWLAAFEELTKENWLT